MDDAALEKRFREGYEAFNRGDYDAAITWMHPDIELHSIGPQGVIRGRDAVLAFLRPDALQGLRLKVLSIEIRGHTLLVNHIASAVGAESGIHVSQEGWQVWEADEEGLAIRTRVFTTRGEAIAAAGWAEG